MTHVFMSGENGDFNYGDQGMALASVDRLRCYLPDLSITATAGYPKTSVLFPIAKKIVPWPQPKPLRLTWIQRALKHLRLLQTINLSQHFEKSFQETYAQDELFRATIMDLEKAAFVFDMGHGGINDIFGRILPYFYWLSHRLNKPLFISGKSIGPITDTSLIDAYRMSMKHAHTVILRDAELSKQILMNTIKIKDSVRLVEAGDDTFDLASVEPDWSKLPTDLKKTIVSQNFFAIQWRPTDYTKTFSFEVYELLVSQITKLNSHFGLQPVFVPMSWESRADIAAAVMLDTMLPEETRFLIIPTNIGARATKWILGQAQFGLGLSYHFHIWLLSQGHPSIGIYTNPYYQVKITGAFRALGYNMPPINLVDLSQGTETLPLTVIENWDEVESSKLIDSATRLAQTWHLAFRDFLKDIGIVSDTP